MNRQVNHCGAYALITAYWPSVRTILRFGWLLAGASLGGGQTWAQNQKDIEGELSLHTTFSKSTYTSKRLALDGSFLASQTDGELGGDLKIDREYVRVPGQSSNINTDRYDANIKKKLFLASHDYYAYVSPRVRHDRYG
jgi:hypothetical protein